MQTKQQRYGSQFDPQSRLVLSGTTVVAELQTPAQQLTPAVPFQPAVLSMRLSAQSETAVAAINALGCMNWKAAQGYKKVGQSIDLHGKEDNLIVREAATYWNQQTTDGYHNMRQKINAEIAEVAEILAEKHIAWTKHYVRRLICKYPPRPKVDRVLNNLGDDFAHDAIHDLSDAEEDEADKLEAVACDSKDKTAVAADGED